MHAEQEGRARPCALPGSLYVVATPLGNLEDITLRALRVLREVHLIAAEDTRHTRKLLQHYGISGRLTRYDEWVEREKAPRLVALLRAGKDVALVADAGTPGIRDPGYHLIRAAIEAGIRVVPVPGPSAVIAAISAAGLSAQRFAFEGFVPERTQARRHWLARMAGEERTWVCFEAARRLPATLADLAELLGARRLVVARELTKLHEEFLRGSAAQVAQLIEARGTPLRGEVTIVVEGRAAEQSVEQDSDWQQALLEALARGAHLKEAAQEIARRFGVSRRTAYQYGLRQRRPEP